MSVVSVVSGVSVVSVVHDQTRPAGQSLVPVSYLDTLLCSTTREI